MSLIVRVLSLLSMFFLIMGCDSDTNVKGRLVVSRDFSMWAEKGSVVVPYELKTGSYEALAQLKDKGRTLYLSVTDQTRKPVFKFDLPHRFPSENGEFSATPAELHQSVGLHGTVKSEYSNSATREDWQSCQVQEQQTVCNPQGCFPQTVWRNGQQRVRSHIRQTLTHVLVDILNDQTVVVGSFSADMTSSEREIEYISPCF